MSESVNQSVSQSVSTVQYDIKALFKEGRVITCSDSFLTYGVIIHSAVSQSVSLLVSLSFSQSISHSISQSVSQ